MEASATRLDTSQQLVDQLVDSISSSDLQTDKVKALLDQLDIGDIDRTHSTSRLSPLETLLSRYPLITSTDAEVLELLLDKGSDLGKVNNGILERLMEVENLEEHQAREEFEAILMEKIQELDQAKDVEEIDSTRVEPAQTDNLSSPFTPLSSSSASTTSSQSIPLRQAVPSQPSPTQQEDASTESPPQSQFSPLPIPSIESFPPSASQNNTTSPPLPMRPSIPSIPALRPSSLMRLYVPLSDRAPPSHNHVLDYFDTVLDIQIFDPVFIEQPCRLYFSIEKDLWETGKLRRKSKAAEIRGELIQPRWYLRFSVAFDEPNDSNEEWIQLAFRGFPEDLTTSRIERDLYRFLPHWRNFLIENEAFYSRGGNDVVVRLSVKGEESARISEKEGQKLMFGGKRIRVLREMYTSSIENGQEGSRSMGNVGGIKSENGFSTRKNFTRDDRWAPAGRRFDSNRQRAAYRDQAQERFSTSSDSRRRSRSESSDRQHSVRRRSRSPSSMGRSSSSFKTDANNGSRFSISRESEEEDEGRSSKRRRSSSWRHG